ncbi:hypothetical protein S40293_11341 [Stachybotrys chartarum IBT 40293]|nr:hypothetical protein S40293_11341 [Stachybotrys chartarum IBT 40293]
MISRIPVMVTVALSLASVVASMLQRSSSDEPGVQRRDAPEPTKCVRDNVWRALRSTQNTAEASSFCSLYIGNRIQTVVASEVTPVITFTDTLTVTTSITFPEIVLDYTTVTEGSLTAQETITKVKAHQAQSVLPKRSYLVTPSFLTRYPAIRVSSGCACLLPAATTTTTPIAGPLTEWHFVVETETITDSPDVTIAGATTITITPTTTITETVTLDHFYLRATDGPEDGNYLKPLVWNGPNRVLGFTEDESDAAKFWLGDDALLRFEDKIGKPKELLSFLNTPYSQQQVFFSPKDIVDGLGDKAYYTTWFVNEDGTLEAINDNEVTTQKVCPSFTYPGFPEPVSVWTLASPLHEDSACSALTLVLEDADEKVPKPSAA